MATEPTRARGVILAYHRVDVRPQDFFHLGIEPTRFREHLEIVRRRFIPVCLEDITKPIEGQGLGNIAVTFDDGYANNLEVASPILVELGIPATFFVNSGALESEDERFWDQLEGVLFDCPHRALELTVGGGETLEWVMETDEERARTFEQVHAHLMRADPGERAEILRKVVEWGGGPRPERPDLRSLTNRELIELAGRPGHAVGAHGENHLLLTAHSREVQRNEVLNDKRRLEAILGGEVRCFAYPFGASDSVSEELVRDAGFALGVRCDPRPVTEGNDRWALPRLDASSLDGPALERTIASFFES